MTGGWSRERLVLAGLLAIAIIVWEALRLANMKVEIGLTPAMVTAALAVLLLLFAFIRFISKPGSGVETRRPIWAWIGIILAILVVVAAWANMKMAGESISEMGASMKSAASSATAAAKAATDKDDAPAAAPAAAAPAPTEPLPQHLLPQHLLPQHLLLRLQPPWPRRSRLPPRLWPMPARRARRLPTTSRRRRAA